MTGPAPAAPAWLDELVLRAEGPPWLAMGLGRVPESAWLLPDERRDAQRAELFAPDPPSTPRPATHPEVGTRFWLRSERPTWVAAGNRRRRWRGALVAFGP